MLAGVDEDIHAGVGGGQLLAVQGASENCCGQAGFELGPVDTVAYNDELQIVYEVVKSPNSYAEEVHGFSHDDAYRGNLERMHKRERDEQDG